MYSPDLSSKRLGENSSPLDGRSAFSNRPFKPLAERPHMGSTFEPIQARFSFISMVDCLTHMGCGIPANPGSKVLYLATRNQGMKQKPVDRQVFALNPQTWSWVTHMTTY